MDYSNDDIAYKSNQKGIKNKKQRRPKIEKSDLIRSFERDQQDTPKNNRNQDLIQRNSSMKLSRRHNDDRSSSIKMDQNFQSGQAAAALQGKLDFPKQNNKAS